MAEYLVAARKGVLGVGNSAVYDDEEKPRRSDRLAGNGSSDISMMHINCEDLFKKYGARGLSEEEQARAFQRAVQR
jgi:hypothetical protein